MLPLIRQAEEVMEKKGGFENATKEEPKTMSNPASIALFDLNDLESIGESMGDSDSDMEVRREFLALATRRRRLTNHYSTRATKNPKARSLCHREPKNRKKIETREKHTRKKSANATFYAKIKSPLEKPRALKKLRAVKDRVEHEAMPPRRILRAKSNKEELEPVTKGKNSASINWDELSRELAGHEPSSTLKQHEDHKKKLTRAPYGKGLFNEYVAPLRCQID